MGTEKPGTAESFSTIVRRRRSKASRIDSMASMGPVSAAIAARCATLFTF